MVIVFRRSKTVYLDIGVKDNGEFITEKKGGNACIS